MKKILTTIIVVTLLGGLVFVLTGCGKKEETKSNNDQSNKTSKSNNDESNKTSKSNNDESNKTSKSQIDDNDNKSQKDFTVLDTKKGKRISDMEITDLKTSKDTYKIGENVRVTVNWKGTPAEDAWIGIIPANVSHGDEEENDNYDIVYIYFDEIKSGKSFDFECMLEPGEYTIRVNESDAGGAELAWCKFSVKN